ncbi:MAG: regulatory protein RecX [Actinomycetota bacterium]
MELSSKLAEAPPGAYRDCMERAGKWLALRPRTRAELGGRLLDSGFAPDVVDAALSRLQELGLVNDLEYARSWVEERIARRPVGGDALVHELTGKGIERETAEQAVAEVAGDETERAREAASSLLPKVARYPLSDQGARLLQNLLRRGFPEEVAVEAVRAVLPPEGWD